jgi:pimeloyl-ACP methyl ester carboxylesterase
MNAMRETGTITGPDGRTIAYADGDPSGYPVLFLHGLGDSRLTRHPDEQLTASLGVRLITIDQPGVGHTEYVRLRSQLEAADRAVAVADALGLDRFAVLGWSAGGPRALAVAAQYPQRVDRVGVAAGFGPLDRPETRALASPQIRQGAGALSALPWLARLFAAPVPRAYRKNPRRAFDQQFGAHASPSDHDLLDDAEIGPMVLAGAQESVRPGSRGMALEMVLLMGRPWGFRPEDVTVPVHLWYGADDRIVPPAMGQQLAGWLPRAELTVFKAEGHLALFGHWQEILGALGRATP